MCSSLFFFFFFCFIAVYNPRNKTQDLLFGLRVESRLISSIIQQQQQRCWAVQISLTWYDYLLHWSLSPDCLAGWNTLATTIFSAWQSPHPGLHMNPSVRAFFQKMVSQSGCKNVTVGASAVTSEVKCVRLWREGSCGFRL